MVTQETFELKFEAEEDEQSTQKALFWLISF